LDGFINRVTSNDKPRYDGCEYQQPLPAALPPQILDPRHRDVLWNRCPRRIASWEKWKAWKRRSDEGSQRARPQGGSVPHRGGRGHQTATRYQEQLTRYPGEIEALQATVAAETAARVEAQREQAVPEKACGKLQEQLTESRERAQAQATDLRQREDVAVADNKALRARFS